MEVDGKEARKEKEEGQEEEEGMEEEKMMGRKMEQERRVEKIMVLTLVNEVLVVEMKITIVLKEVGGTKGKVLGNGRPLA